MSVTEEGLVLFDVFPKIARLKREICITEKLDGTNGAIQIVPAVDNNEPNNSTLRTAWTFNEEGEAFDFFVQSRNKFITPENDNYGFAKWVAANAVDLLRLGPGTHFGEWWGNGIQRRYNQVTKRFSLFNVARWENSALPNCLSTVPVLYRGEDHSMIDYWITELKSTGSRAAPGFMDPEGIVIYHSAMRTLSKVTCQDDEKPKGVVARDSH